MARQRCLVGQRGQQAPHSGVQKVLVRPNQIERGPPGLVSEGPDPLAGAPRPQRGFQILDLGENPFQILDQGLHLRRRSPRPLATAWHGRRAVLVPTRLRARPRPSRRLIFSSRKSIILFISFLICLELIQHDYKL